MKVVSVAELGGNSENFVDLDELDGTPLQWQFFGSRPQNAVERLITRPQLSRYRAAWQAASASRQAAAIISHLPLMTEATSKALRLRRESGTPHLAFSFNFTALPSRARRKSMGEALKTVDQMTVYTNFEVQLYSEAFDLPPERFARLDWTQKTPVAGLVEPSLLPEKPFVVAVGGEGRDFDLLLAVATAMPHLAFVIIARPHPSLDNLPANVRLLFNIPAELCWGIAAKAAFTLIPLRDDKTCCGHITLVSARLLGIPIITSRSEGTREYSEGYSGTVIAEPGRPDDWIALLTDLVPQAGEYHARAAVDQRLAAQRHDRRHWTGFVAEFLRQNVTQE